MYKNFKKVEIHPILQHRVTLKKRFFNLELKLIKIFFEITETLPTNIICFNTFYLFFIPDDCYFKAKCHLKKLKRTIRNKKVLLIRDNPTLLTLLINFFPDVYIHDIRVGSDEQEEKKKTTIKIILLTSEELSIAVEKGGEYIKLVNSIIQKYIKSVEIEIKCELVYP
jgi:hypothetical protein